MGQPAVVLGDKLNGTCSIHLMPNPASGAPQPSPPLPFSAPMTMGTCATVMIANKPTVVIGSQGLNTPPHVGLHPSDPFMAPPAQQGIVTQGSATVFFGGTPAARTGDQGTCCGMPVGVLAGTAATVMIG